MNRGSVTLVSNNYWTLYKFRYDVIQMLVDEGYSVNLIAKKDSYHKYFSNKNIKKYFLPLQERGKNIFNEIQTFLAIYKLHKRINPQIVFNFTLKPNIYSSISTRILGIKTISMITGLGHIFIQKNNFLKYLVINILRVSLKKSNEVWFTNKFDREYFRQKSIIIDQKTFIVPGAGIKINDQKISRQHINGKCNFIMISRLLKEKGVSEFLSAAKYFKNDIEKNFILIGAHSDDKYHISKKMLDECVEEKIIQYHLYTDDIDGFLKRSHCIIHPSHREGVSTVLLEAASLKIPIITTKVPGCIDIVLNEDYGFLCEVSDSKSLIGKIIEFINENKKSPESIDLRTNKVFEHVSENFNRKNIIEKFKSTVKQH
jgi:glycosyltransferase involved in cell wall biosynthesis